MSADPATVRGALLVSRTKSLRKLTHPRAEDILRDALRATRRLEQSIGFFAKCPPARSASIAFAWYVTDHVPFPDPLGFDETPLLDTCIERAFTFLDANAWEEPELDMTELLKAYLAGLFQNSTALVEVEIRGSGGAWDMLTGGPLGDFLQREPRAQLSLVKIPEHLADVPPLQIRAALISRILPDDTLAAIGGDIRRIVDPERETSEAAAP